MTYFVKFGVLEKKKKLDIEHIKNSLRLKFIHGFADYREVYNQKSCVCVVSKPATNIGYKQRLEMDCFQSAAARSLKTLVASLTYTTNKY